MYVFIPKKRISGSFSNRECTTSGHEKMFQFGDTNSPSSRNNSADDDGVFSFHSDDDGIEEDYNDNDQSPSMSKTNPGDILPSLNIKKDIDSIMMLSSNPFSLIASLNEDAICVLSSSISRLRSSRSSRFNVILENDNRIRYRGSSIGILSLGIFPNITIANFINKNIEFFFNMYWINPEFIPNVPYFHDELMLTLIASLNYARHSCLSKIYDFPQHSIPSNVSNLDMKNYVSIQARNNLPKFCLDSRKRKNKEQPIELKSAAVFFGEVMRCMKALSLGEYKGHSIRDFLPYDHDNAFFGEKVGNNKLLSLSTTALKLVNSLSFIISTSNQKAVISSQYFNTEMTIPPIPKDKCHKKFMKFDKACDKLFTNFMKSILKEEVNGDVHVYYDYGLEMNATDTNTSLLLSLESGFSSIEKIIHGHNNCNDKRLPEEDVLQLAESLLQDTNENEEESSESVSEYLSWFTGMQKSKYRTFFQTQTGNWHTGQNRVRRKTCDGNAVKLEHRSKPGICSAQGYSPQSRKLQHKILRTASKHIDGLPHAVFSLLRQREWREPKNTFTNILKDVLVHLREIEEHSRTMKNEQISIRYECLMKLCTCSKEVSFPAGFLNIPIYSVNTSALGAFYHERVKELTQSILSLFPKIGENSSAFSNITLFSPEVKTMIVLQCELLAYEFGAANKMGTIMKELKPTFDRQGFIGLSRSSEIRLPLSESDKKLTSIILNGISPSYLPFHMDTILNEEKRGLLNISKVHIPIAYSSLNSISVHGVQVSSKIPVTFEQHHHLLKSLLHKFLTKKSNQPSQETAKNVNTLECDIGTCSLFLCFVNHRNLGNET